MHADYLVNGMQTRSPSSCQAVAPSSALLSSCHGPHSPAVHGRTAQAPGRGRHLPFVTPTSSQLRRPTCRSCCQHGAPLQAERRHLQWQRPHACARRLCCRTTASASAQSTGVSVFPAGGHRMHGVLLVPFSLAMHVHVHRVQATTIHLAHAQAKARRRCGCRLYG